MQNKATQLTFKSLVKATQTELERITRGILYTHNTDSLKNFNLDCAIASESEQLKSRCDEYKDGFAEVRERRKILDSVCDEQLHDQLVYLPDGSMWLTGIYRNHDDQTLIEVISEKPLSVNQLKAYLPQLLAFFSWCQPEWVCIFTRPESETYHQFLKLEGAQVEDCFLGAEITDIPLVEHCDIQLRAFDMKSHLHWYQTEFQHFHTSQPHLASRVEIETQDTLQEAIDRNQLFIAEVRGPQDPQIIGALMAEDVEELGYKSLLVSDFLIAKAYRGKGYGVKIQSAVIDKLKNGKEFFCGYIYAGNLASLNNAKKNRKLLRTEIAVPVSVFY